jgi:hypothetical protein
MTSVQELFDAIVEWQKTKNRWLEIAKRIHENTDRVTKPSS